VTLSVHKKMLLGGLEWFQTRKTMVNDAWLIVVNYSICLVVWNMTGL
jgi:hypothetical protein